eukprot:COSAG06_NODE_57165_length_281_cov_0.923077_2_plen_28_part_01
MLTVSCAFVKPIATYVCEKGPFVVVAAE